MPRRHVLVSTPVKNSFRVSAMRGMFDVPLEEKLTHEWDVDLPIEEKPWNIGLIVGSSGSGKTVIASNLFDVQAMHSGFEWDREKSILDHFPEQMEIKEITTLLSHVGFSSPPYWAKPFHVLSNGQKFRVELARILAQETPLTIIDEFTSVIDRESAKVGSFALSKTAKRMNRKIICLSCHRDIIEWLEPDWVYDTDAQTFARGSLQRPQIEIELHEVDKTAWQIFKRHHYLSAQLASAAQCFVGFYKGVPVAFTSYVHSVGYFGIKREHRTVVLPDFQGIGLGEKISDSLWSHLKSKGLRVTSTLSHPALIRARIKSGKWLLKFIGHQIANNKSPLKSAHTSNNRVTARMEYVGLKKEEKNTSQN